jgi:hypothetical protein
LSFTSYDILDYFFEKIMHLRGLGSAAFTERGIIVHKEVNVEL